MHTICKVKGHIHLARLETGGGNAQTRAGTRGAGWEPMRKGTDYAVLSMSPQNTRAVKT